MSLTCECLCAQEIFVTATDNANNYDNIGNNNNNAWQTYSHNIV